MARKHRVQYTVPRTGEVLTFATRNAALRYLHGEQRKILRASALCGQPVNQRSNKDPKFKLDSDGNPVQNTNTNYTRRIKHGTLTKRSFALT